LQTAKLFAEAKAQLEEARRKHRLARERFRQLRVELAELEQQECEAIRKQAGRVSLRLQP